MNTRKNDPVKRAETILSAHVSGELPPEVEQQVLAWMAKYGDSAPVSEVLRRFWDKTVSLRGEEMSEEAMERWDRYKKLLGFPEEYSAEEKEKVERIYAERRRMESRLRRRRMLVQAVAVVIPVVLLLVGANWFLKERLSGPVDEAKTIAKNEQLQGWDSFGIPVAEPAAEEAEVKEETKGITQTRESELEPRAGKEETISDYDMVVFAPSGTHRHIVLPDRSVVLLNGGGQFAYSKERREVRLDGEAYFNVASGGSTPFLVKTKLLTVEVTGTEFNVQTTGAGEATLVEVISGSVNVQVGDDHEMTLAKDEKLSFDEKSGAVKLAPMMDPGWWAEPFTFENRTLRQILEEVEVLYHIQISGTEQMQDTTSYNIKFSKLSTVPEILDVMIDLVPRFEYSKNDRGITVTRRDEQIIHENENSD